jgi:cell division protein FtsL
MSAKGELGWMNKLWKMKFIILLGLAVIILAAATYYYYGQSAGRAAELSNKSAELDALNAKYANLSSEHLALVASHNNLSERYSNLSERFTSVSSNESSLRSSYESLNSSVSGFQEKGGPRIALYYRAYRGGTTDEPKLILDTTAYNVGDNKASRVTIKCRVLYDGQPNLNEQTFTNVAPLDKRNYTWEFSILAQIESVWVEYA